MHGINSRYTCRGWFKKKKKLQILKFDNLVLKP